LMIDATSQPCQIRSIDTKDPLPSSSVEVACTITVECSLNADLVRGVLDGLKVKAAKRDEEAKAKQQVKP